MYNSLLYFDWLHYRLAVCQLYFIHRCRPILPDYLLDFGHVVLGDVCSRTVTVTNTGWFPVSFSIDRASRHQSGFSVELPRVVQLPGSPDHEALDFNVTFDPRGANLGTGIVEVFVPINVSSPFYLASGTSLLLISTYR